VSEFWLAGCYPRRWRWEPFDSFYSEIIVNWLEIEVDEQAEIRLPVLRQIYGHRRREIVDWFAATKDRRYAETTYALYGSPGACL
jgi:hypothetical protein